MGKATPGTTLTSAASEATRRRAARVTSPPTERAPAAERQVGEAGAALGRLTLDPVRFLVSCLSERISSSPRNKTEKRAPFRNAGAQTVEPLDSMTFNLRRRLADEEGYVGDRALLYLPVHSIVCYEQLFQVAGLNS